METFSALPALCVWKIPSQRPVTRSFNAFFHLCVNKRLSKQSWDWRLETPSCLLWRHCNFIILQELFTGMFMAIYDTEKIQIYVSSSYTVWLMKYPLLNGDYNTYLVANKIPFYLDIPLVREDSQGIFVNFPLGCFILQWIHMSVIASQITAVRLFVQQC